MKYCDGCFSCIQPCGREEMELLIDKMNHYVYYDTVGDVLITLNVKLQFDSPYLVLIGEL